MYMSAHMSCILSHVRTYVSMCVSVDVQVSLLHVHPKLILDDSAAVLPLVHAVNMACLYVQPDEGACHCGFGCIHLLE